MQNRKIPAILATVMGLFLSDWASAAILEVPAQHATIAGAIAASQVGDEIKISSGIYQESGLVIREGITLSGQGDGPLDCIIDGGGQGRILTVQFASGTTLLRNLTFVNGHASGQAGYDASGGAVYINSSDVRMESCRFENNRADASGGAVRCMLADPVVQGCFFQGNVAVEGGGAVDVSYSASPLVLDSVFLNNQADFGGAVAGRGQGVPVFTDCVFDGNKAEGDRSMGGGAAVFFQNTPDFVRCIFSRNTADRGGALFDDEGAPADLTDSTILQNTARQAGGGIYTRNVAPTIDSSLIVFQAGEAVTCEGSAVPQVACTDIYGNTGGDWTGAIASQLELAGNLSVDPQFCSLDLDRGFDLVLQSGSPCTIEGGACADLGALGTGCYSSVEPDEDPGDQPPAMTVDRLGAWPNPFNPRTNIHFELGAGQRVSVEIYSIDGRRVRTLARQHLAAGPHDLAWTGTDDGGRALASGPYVVLVAGEKDSRRVKVTLLK